MNKKKAQGLPVNVVVMMIIGIIIFGIGFSMFSKFSSKGEKQISDLSNKIKTDIANLECNSNEWICSPSDKLKNGETKIFQVFVSNNGQSKEEFSINLKTSPINSKQGIINSCGSIILGYYKGAIKISSGHSGEFPIEVIASRVNKTPCSFVTKATLKTNPSNLDGDKETTAIIIRVE